MVTSLPRLLVFVLAGFGAETPQQADTADQQKVQGTWNAVAVKNFDSEVPQSQLSSLRITITGNRLVAHYGDKIAEGTFKLDATALPRRIDVTLSEGPESVKGKKFEGIYLLEGDMLRIAYRNPGGTRPSAFPSKNESEGYEITFRKGTNR